MPTSNPRINVTLSPTLDALVSRLAAVERVSKSMVLRELLEAAQPSLEEAVVLMERAKGAGLVARTRVASDMQKGLETAREAQHLALQLITSNQRDIVVEAEAVRGRRPPRSLAPGRADGGEAVAAQQRKKGKRPLLSNRGVK